MPDALKASVAKTVAIDADLIRKAKHIATTDGKTVREVIEVAAAPAVERRYRKIIEREAADLGDPIA